LGWFFVVGGAFLQGDCDFHKWYLCGVSLVVSAILGSFAGSYEPRCRTANFFLFFEIYFWGFARFLLIDLVEFSRLQAPS
jgi:hypothetical protein